MGVAMAAERKIEKLVSLPIHELSETANINCTLSCPKEELQLVSRRRPWFRGIAMIGNVGLGTDQLVGLRYPGRLERPQCLELRLLFLAK